MPGSPTLDELASDPHPHLARLRAAAPVAFVPALDGYLVVGRDAALEVLRDAVSFTVDDPRFTTARVVGPSMLSTDGAEHARHRTPFAGPFRPRMVTARFGAAVATIVDRSVATVAARDRRRAEIRAEVAGPVAAAVVAATLGLDDDVAVPRLLGWYRAIVAAVAGLSAGGEVTVEATDAMRDLAGALEQAMGRPSLLAESAGSLDPDEVVSNAAVIMFGGIETTEAMILNALWFLLQADEQPAIGDVAATAAAVEESLRLEPAAAVVDRYATTDTVVGGVSIRKGSLVSVSLAGANRDPVEFPDPDRFDPARANLRRQLAFAAGPHVCIGMDLARLETVATVTALRRALPGLRLDPGTPPPTGLVFRKPARLDVMW